MDRGLSHYRQSLDALFARSGATSRYGLERTLELLERLGNPHSRISTIHVAGTNGKGSVVAILAALLADQGKRTGVYTSPHLIDFRERIVVDGTEIDEEYVVSFLDQWAAESERIGATFFEITTAMAFQYFADRNVDIAVIETGLGGRLDATNVIRPVVSGITSIGIDHVEYLGHTEAEIAREKAGVFKPGIPAVIGPMSGIAREAVRGTALEAGAPEPVEAHSLYAPSRVEVHGDFTRFVLTHEGASAPLTSGLIGSQQADNASVALAMLHEAGPSWQAGLDRASHVLPSLRLPGRFHRAGKFIFDVAHNPDGVATLVQTLDRVSPPRPLSVVLGVLGDKDWRGMVRLLAPHTDRFFMVAPPTAPESRAWDPAIAAAFAESLGSVALHEPDFAGALARANEQSGTVVVTGSFHTVGDSFVVLGGSTSPACR